MDFDGALLLLPLVGFGFLGLAEVCFWVRVSCFCLGGTDPWAVRRDDEASSLPPLRFGEWRFAPSSGRYTVFCTCGCSSVISCEPPNMFLNQLTIDEKKPDKILFS
jgi:hypothetical protein